MKTANSIITAFWVAGSLVLGFALIFSFFGLFNSIESFDNVYSILTRRPWSLLFGLLFSAAGIFYIFMTLTTLRRNQYIAFENPSGEVTISVAAVEDFVYRTAKDFVEVKELYPSIKAKNNGVSICIRAVFWSGANIPEVTEKMQNEVKRQVQSILGIENIANVEIKVSKIETKGTELSPKTDLFEEETY